MSRADEPFSDEPGRDRAEALFAAYLARLRGQPGPDPRELAGGDEELAAEVEELRGHWERVQGVLDRLGSESLRRPGLGSIDPQISLEPDRPRSAGVSDDDPAPGDEDVPEFWTQYRVLREVARGAMGAVFRVHDPSLRRKLAMKVALRRDGGVPVAGEELDPPRLSRFLEEAQITGQLEHPGIVPVHELGLDVKGRAYFTMRLVRGVDLKEIIERVHSGADEWTQTRALGVLLRVCEAVAFAHAKHVVHRDLKPSNVMVGRFGETYVMDWGLAKVLGREDQKDIRVAVPASAESISVVETDRRVGSEDGPESALFTMDGDVIGTPAYMPPEQARGDIEAVGPTSDVYSVGAMLYHLLTGQRPYIGKAARVSPRTVLAAVLRGPPAPVHELESGVPAELEAICERAMQREPTDRYPGMLEMAEDLRAYLEGRVVRAYETGAAAELRKWMRRNRGLAAAWVAVLLLVIASLAAFAALQATKRATEQRLTQEAKDAAEQAEGQALRAKREEARALEALARIQVDVDRLSLEDLYEEQGPLWPVNYPDLAELEERLADWLAEADPIYGRFDEHVALLAELRAHAAPYDDEQREADRRAALQESPELPSQREALRVGLSMLASSMRDSEGLERQRFDEERARTQARLDQVEAELDRRRTWDFADPELRSRHRSLQGAVATIEDYFEMATWVRGRLEVVRQLEERTLSGADARGRWARAIAGVASSAAYGGLALEPLRGLLPLGADPESGLWEFFVFGSGDEPVRDPATGRFAIAPGTGVVLVLVPGGRFLMGSSHDVEGGSPTDAAPAEQPVVEVLLDPFFIGKYEITEEQCVRYGGPPVLGIVIEKEPVGDEPAAFPAHRLSRDAAGRVARNMGLSLPSEAQWEYACRAGSTTAWFTGDDPRSLNGYANLRNFGSFGRADFAPVEQDEFPYMLPVGRLEPNAFGLHDIQGNVREICADSFYPNLAVVPFEQKSGLRFDPNRTSVAVRGACYREEGWEAHSAHRASMPSKNMQVPENGMRVSLELR